jgi:CheY-like chemotaxis protein
MRFRLNLQRRILLVVAGSMTAIILTSFYLHRVTVRSLIERDHYDSAISQTLALAGRTSAYDYFSDLEDLQPAPGLSQPLQQQRGRDARRRASGDFHAAVARGGRGRGSVPRFGNGDCPRRGRTDFRADKEGAFDYISKPFQLDELVATVRRALGARANGPAPAEDGERTSGIVGRTPAMLEVYKMVARGPVAARG